MSRRRILTALLAGLGFWLAGYMLAVRGDPLGRIGGGMPFSSLFLLLSMICLFCFALWPVAAQMLWRSRRLSEAQRADFRKSRMWRFMLNLGPEAGK